MQDGRTSRLCWRSPQRHHLLKPLLRFQKMNGGSDVSCFSVCAFGRALFLHQRCLCKELKPPSLPSSLPRKQVLIWYKCFKSKVTWRAVLPCFISFFLQRYFFKVDMCSWNTIENVYVSQKDVRVNQLSSSSDLWDFWRFPGHSRQASLPGSEFALIVSLDHSTRNDDTSLNKISLNVIFSEKSFLPPKQVLMIIYCPHCAISNVYLPY